jgi:methionyl-tRNA formyltransferase
LENSQVKAFTVLLFGTSEFSSVIFEEIVTRCPRFKVLGLVCPPDKPQGRGYRLTPPPAKFWAERHHIEVFQPLRLDEFRSRLSMLAPDLGWVVAYGKLLPGWMLNPLQFFPQGVFNVHTSLLPKFRGASPIRSALKSGASETGLTIQRLVEKLDAGPIWIQKRTPLPTEWIFDDVENRLLQMIPELMVQVCQQFPPSESALIAQDERDATFSMKDSPKDWQMDLAETKDWNYVRAFLTKPGLWCTLEGKRLFKMIRALPLGSGLDLDVGSAPLIRRGSQLFLNCQGSPDWIQLLELQSEGKQRQPVKDWLNGQKEFLSRLKIKGVFHEVEN